MAKFRVTVKPAYEDDLSCGRLVDEMPFSIVEVEKLLHASDPGTYEVEVTKVPPRAARIRQPNGLAWNCANCGLPWGTTSVRCGNCDAVPGRLIDFADLRDQDGKPLVEE